MKKKFLSFVLVSMMALSMMVGASVWIPQVSADPCMTVTKTVVPDEIYVAYTDLGLPEWMTVTIEVTGYGGLTTERLPMDVVYAIDSSGSMSWNDPSGLRKTAAKDFTDKLDDTVDQAGVVSWDDNIDFTYGLTQNFPTLKTQIDNVDSSGGTNLNVGLTASIAMLDAEVRTSAKAIIFLSNGGGTYTFYPGNPVAQAAAKGYVIYSIGLGASPWVAALTDMATCTGGQYFSAPSPANLDAIFDAIYQLIIISTAPKDVDVIEVTQPHIIDESSFNPAPDQIIGDNTFIWEDVGSKVDNMDGYLTADETFTATFQARCTKAGYHPVDVYGDAKVTYTDPTGAPCEELLPQAYVLQKFRKQEVELSTTNYDITTYEMMWDGSTSWASTIFVLDWCGGWLEIECYNGFIPGDFYSVWVVDQDLGPLWCVGTTPEVPFPGTDYSHAVFNIWLSEGIYEFRVRNELFDSLSPADLAYMSPAGYFIGFHRKYWLTLDSDPTGLEPPPTAEGTYPSGWVVHVEPPGGWFRECTLVTLTAPTIAWYNTTALDRMYTFYYWEIDGERFGENPLMIHMDADHTAIAVYVEGPIDPIGDVNWDGHINIRDLTLIAQYFATTPRSEKYYPACDINNDGIIDIVDLSTAAKYFGYSQLNPPT